MGQQLTVFCVASEDGSNAAVKAKRVVNQCIEGSLPAVMVLVDCEQVLERMATVLMAVTRKRN